MAWDRALRHTASAAAAAALILGIAAPASGDVFNVPEDFTCIQDAIDATQDGDTVLIATGTYTGPCDRDLDFGGRLITVMGATGDPADVIINCEGAARAFHFHSGETAAAIVKALTIRSGAVNEANGGAILCDTSGPTIEDCVFTSNTATGTTDYTGWGGAIHCENASPAITNCSFTGNLAGGTGPDTAGGGAVGCLNGSAPVISLCTFDANVASGADGSGAGSNTTGGAIACELSCSLIVSDCVFTANTAESQPTASQTAFGGAVFLATACDGTFIDCTFTGNSAVASGASGGVFFVFQSSITLEGCTLNQNTASQGGGAVWVQDGPATITACTFDGNSGQSGGAIGGFAGGAFAIENSTFTNNSVSSTNSLQQLIGGGAVALFQSSATVAGSTFTGNTSDDGMAGAFSVTSSVATMVNCEFRDNHAFLDGGALNVMAFPIISSSSLVNCLFACNSTQNTGGAICSTGAVLDLGNCTLAGNSAVTAGGGLFVPGDPESTNLDNCVVHGNSAPIAAQIGGDTEVLIFARYSIIEGGWTGEGNLNADPQFADTSPPGCLDDDFRLGPDSPAIDAGDNDALTPDVLDVDGDGDVTDTTPLDLDGNPRRADDHCTADRGNGTSPIVDQGAYEYPPVIDGCDCNDNGVADSQDILDGTSLDFNGNVIPDECENAFDGTAMWIDPDGGLFRFAANWQPGTPGPSNPALFSLDASYTVTFDDDDETSRLIARRGDVTFDVGTSEYRLNGITDASIAVGEDLTGEAALTVVSGLVSAAGDIQIAAGIGSEGTLRVTGSNTDLVTEENLCVGCFGAGTLLIDGGGRVLSRDAVIGDQPDAVGLAHVSGRGSIWDVPFFLSIERGALVVESGATVVAGIDPFSGIFVFDDGEISGDGTIDATVVNFGLMRPTVGFDPLHVQRDYVQSGLVPGLGPASGSLRVEVGGTTPGLEHGQLLVTGQALLAGGLFVDLAGGFEPQLADSFQLVDATALAGQFDVAFMPALAGDRFMRVTYGGAVAGTGVVTIDVETLADLLDFGNPTGEPVPGQPTDATIGDFDGDGRPDLAITIAAETPGADGSVLVLINDGRGGFGATQQITVGVDPVAVTVGRFDPDTVLDLAVANRGSDTVSVIFNDGFGVFGPPIDVATGSEPVSVAAGRLLEAGPGGDDLVVGNGGDGTVLPLENDGTGMFDPRDPLQLGGLPGSGDACDVDDDKDDDIVVTNQTAGTLMIFENISVGATLAFGEPLVIPVGAVPLAIAYRGATPGDIDLDGNGFSDLVTVNFGDGTVSIVLNEGGLQFTPAVNLPVGDAPVSIAALDIEQDGDVDLAVVANNESGEPALLALRNDLNGGEQLAFAQPIDLGAAAGPLIVLSGDLDQDSDEDLVTINEGLAGVAAGGAPSASLEVLPNLTFGIPGDINGDGLVDVFDLLEVILHWGPCPAPPAPCPADTNDDGEVNVLDLLAVILYWS